MISTPLNAEIYSSSPSYAPIETRCGDGQSRNLSSSEFDEISRIRYIHDGDTLHLIGGRKVRLIGINTPELARNNQPAEPFAIPAKNALKSLFANNKKIALIYGKDKTDRYGRLLAHAFTDDGQNVQTQLLKQGLASVITIPPNTRFARCYLATEQQARCAHIGLWQNNGIIAAKDLKRYKTGFHLVRGTVIDIDFNEKGIWLNLDNTITIGIRPDEEYLFDKKMLKTLKNQSITVRGWYNKSRYENPYYMRIKHPLAIQKSSELVCE